MDTVTIAQAAAQTGMSAKAIARRVERGTLAAIVKDGKRRIPVTELDKLPRGTTETATETATAGEGNHRGTTVDVAQILSRLETLAGENMKLRLLAEQNSSLEENLKRELIEARARIAQLEARNPRRFWRSRRLAVAE
jgi:hypothetical protein